MDESAAVYWPNPLNDAEIEGRRRERAHLLCARLNAYRFRYPLFGSIVGRWVVGRQWGAGHSVLEFWLDGTVLDRDTGETLRIQSKAALPVDILTATFEELRDEALATMRRAVSDMAVHEVDEQLVDDRGARVREPHHSV